MKKFLLTFLLSGSALCAFSQYSLPNKTTFGIKAGVNIANAEYTVRNMDGSYKFASLTDFSAGIFADIVVNQNFSVHPGLYYTGKGLKIDEALANFEFEPGFTGSLQTDMKSRIAYAELPLHFLYNGNTSAGKFFLGVGPFGAVAVSAKQKGTAKVSFTLGGQTQTETQDIDEKIEIGKEDGVKRFDYGATALAGYRFNNGLLFSAGYDHGLVNIFQSDNGEVLKTRTFTFSVGFSF